jgi:acetyl-CoA carboxylase biotin carboxyl carrier protein
MSDDKKPPLSFEDVQEILRILEKSTFNELHLNISGLHLRLRRDGSAQPNPPAWESAEPAAEKQIAQPAPRVTQQASPVPDGLIEIRAPTLGTFYAAPRPGAPPFVEVGTRLDPNTVIGIIEIMKLMNAVPSGVDGEIREICVQNGEAVEYGQVLMRVSPLGK